MLQPLSNGVAKISSEPLMRKLVKETNLSLMAFFFHSYLLNLTTLLDIFSMSSPSYASIFFCATCDIFMFLSWFFFIFCLHYLFVFIANLFFPQTIKLEDRYWIGSHCFLIPMAWSIVTDAVGTQDIFVQWHQLVESWCFFIVWVQLPFVNGAPLVYKWQNSQTPLRLGYSVGSQKETFHRNGGLFCSLKTETHTINLRILRKIFANMKCSGLWHRCCDTSSI